MKHREPHPPIVAETGLFVAFVLYVSGSVELGVLREDFATVDLRHSHQTLAAEAKLVPSLLIASVDLRSVPPVGDVIRRRFSEAGLVLAAGLIVFFRAIDELFSTGAFHAVWITFFVLTVCQPVVIHELNPNGREHVQERNRFEFVSREEFLRHVGRIRNHEFFGCLLIDELRRNVSAEGDAGRACEGLRYVIASSVGATESRFRFRTIDVTVTDVADVRVVKIGGQKILPNLREESQLLDGVRPPDARPLFLVPIGPRIRIRRGITSGPISCRYRRILDGFGGRCRRLVSAREHQ